MQPQLHLYPINKALRMKISIVFSTIVLAAGCAAPPNARVASPAAPGGTEYHVSPQGSDANEGSRARMLKTISAAALRAQPGDVITAHGGIGERGGVALNIDIQIILERKRDGVLQRQIQVPRAQQRFDPARVEL